MNVHIFKSISAARAGNFSVLLRYNRRNRYGAVGVRKAQREHGSCMDPTHFCTFILILWNFIFRGVEEEKAKKTHDYPTQ